MSFGAFGGRAEIMACVRSAQERGIEHAGTFNNNVMTMAAGWTGLTQIFTPEAARALTARGDALREALNSLLRHQRCDATTALAR